LKIKYFCSFHFLCIDVCGYTGNVAIGKTATASSTARLNHANLALDGKKDPVIDTPEPTCFHAGGKETETQWWMVDLGSHHDIKLVTIYSYIGNTDEPIYFLNLLPTVFVYV
jgi:hypothetical protein